MRRRYRSSKYTDTQIEILFKLTPQQFKDEIYSRYYADWISNNPLTKHFHNLMHAGLEKNLEHYYFAQTLEIGALNLQHFPFVRHKFDKYITTDVLDFSGKPAEWSVVDRRIEFLQDDITKTKLHAKSMDRIVVTCVLHHVSDVESALLGMRSVCKDNGIIDILLPHDPGLLFRLAKNLGPYRDARKLNYLKIKKLMDAREHINHYLGILELVEFIFRNDHIKIRKFPNNFLGYDMNLWSHIRIKKCDS
jgi:phosphatidylethanolamine/phosphatidyl-N-methylethanolamine N-methyltransferase